MREALFLALLLLASPAHAAIAPDSCGLAGKRFISKNKTEVGMGLEGVVMDYAIVAFHARQTGLVMQWKYGDMLLSAPFRCDNNQVSATFSNQPPTKGTYQPDTKELVWNGLPYTEQEQ